VIAARKPLTAAIAAAAGLVLIAGSIAQHPIAHADTSTSVTPSTGPITNVSISIDSCGGDWTNPQPGQQTFVLHSEDNDDAEVFLTDPTSSAIYGLVEPLTPNASANLSIYLGSGNYQFRCAWDEKGFTAGPVVTVPGNVKAPVPAVKAVTLPELIKPVVKYKTYVAGKLPTLQKQVKTLRRDITSNSRTKARKAWLAAHLTYETLGAAYGLFGDLDGAINGTTAGLPKGVKDKGFTGFHRLEYGLWHGQSLTSLKPAAKRLAADVDQLTATATAGNIDPLELTIRAHEITENALQFELTGETNYGSGSNLATISANLAGTKVVLDLLKPVLTSRYPKLKSAYNWLATARLDIAHDKSKGRYRSLASLSLHRREVLNTDLSELTELLAPVAAIAEPRATHD
jgi:iron uptake system component EfeO